MKDRKYDIGNHLMTVANMTSNRRQNACGRGVTPPTGLWLPELRLTVNG
jgi:hypothetical protein